MAYSVKTIGPGEDLIISQSDYTYGNRARQIMKISGTDGKITYTSDISINGSLNINGILVTPNSHPAPTPAGSTSETFSERGEFYAIGSNETWILEYLVDFSNLSATLTASLTGFTKQSGTLGGTYMLRLGGTPGQADGLLVGTLFTSNDSYLNTPDMVTGAQFTNPLGWKLIKLSASGTSISAKASIRNPTIEIG